MSIYLFNVRKLKIFLRLLLDLLPNSGPLLVLSLLGYKSLTPRACIPGLTHPLAEVGTAVFICWGRRGEDLPNWGLWGLSKKWLVSAQYFLYNNSLYCDSFIQPFHIPFHAFVFVLIHNDASSYIFKLLCCLRDVPCRSHGFTGCPWACSAAPV